VASTTYLVSFDLVLGPTEDRSDSLAVAERALVELALVELRRLGAEDAWARTRTDRGGPVLELAVTMRAGDQHEAVTRAARILRTALAGCGLATSGWDRLATPSTRPVRRRAAMTGGPGRSRRSGSRSPATTAPDEPPSLWDAHTAVARSRLDRGPTLPPLVVRLGPDPVIDLR
jgi:hypothetical protein